MILWEFGAVVIFILSLLAVLIIALVIIMLVIVTVQYFYDARKKGLYKYDKELKDGRSSKEVPYCRTGYHYQYDKHKRISCGDLKNITDENLR